MLWKSIVSKSLSEKRKKKNSGSDAGFAQWYIGVSIAQVTLGGTASICFKLLWPRFCEKFKNTHCQDDHPAKME